MRNDKIIYKLVVGDLQEVANDILKRDLTEEEINMLSEKIGEYIDWYDAIQSSIMQFKVWY